MLAGVEHGPIGDHADDLAAGDDQSAVGGQPPGLFQHQVRRGDAVIGQIDRDLRPPVLIDVPADSLAVGELAGAADLLADRVREIGNVLGQFTEFVIVNAAAVLLGLLEGLSDEVAVAAREVAFPIEEHFAAGVMGGVGLGAGDAARLTKLEGDVRGGGLVAGVERDVVGDQELAGADDRRARAGIEPRRAAVRLPPLVLEFLGQPLILALADRRQIPPLGRQGGGFVEIDGNLQLVANPLTDAMGDGGTVLQRHALDRHEGADVGGAEAGMGAVVAAHVEHGRRLGNRPERRLGHRLRRANEGDHGPVGVPAGVHVEEPDARNRLDGVGDLLDFGGVLSFGEVGHALDQWGGH